MFNKRKYEQERDFERQSQIRLRGRLWFRLLIFALYVVMGAFIALVVGTFARVLWYCIANGLGNLLLNRLGYYIDPAFSIDYLQQYLVFSLSGGTLLDHSWITWTLMVIVFLLILRLGFKNNYDWGQKFADRTTNQNRWATLKEIDAVYKLIPDRNKFYKGLAGEPITHISGYSVAFLKLHPVLWLIQIIKAPFGLNRQEFPKSYQTLRTKLLKTPGIKSFFKGQASVTGGFEGFFWIDTTPTHTSITAPTRIGKDQRIGYPTIDVFRRAEIQPNIIDTDAKNEDGKMSFVPLLKAGYDVSFVNIIDPNWSELWNPLQAALDYAKDGELDAARDEASVIVQIIGSTGAENTENDTWDKSAEDTQLAIILVLLWLAIEHDDDSLATPASVPQLINSLGQFSDPKDKNKDGLAQYFNMLRQLDPLPPILNEAILKAGSYLQATGDTRTSVMFTLQRHSSLFASETVAKLTSRSTIHISDYGFPRMLKVMLPEEYAGLTAYVELYDAKHVETKIKDYFVNAMRILRHPIKGWRRGAKPFLEQDSMKVSSSGVIHYPFKNYFPEDWLIRVHFENKDNPHHLRKDWVELPGERRLKYSLGGKQMFDPYTGKPEFKIVPKALKYKLFEGRKAKYDLRYSEKPKATFIVASQNNDNYSALASLFIGQVFSVNTQIASEITRRKMDRWIVYKLNEFGMWPQIPGFENFLTRGLTYGHIVNIYLQDDIQIGKNYSDKDAREIKSNMATQYYLQTKDKDTKKELSERLGEIEVQKEMVNSQMGEQQQDRSNRVVSIETKPLMPEKDIEELLDGEVIVMRTAKRNDKRWRRVRALPIFDTKATIMPNSRDLLGATYSLDYYTTDLPIENHVKHLAYNDLFQDFSPYFYELQDRLSMTATSQVNVGPLMKDVNEKDLQDALNIAYERDNPQLSPKQVSEQDLYTQWQENFSSDLDAPFMSDKQLANIPLVMEVEELIKGLLKRKHNTKRTDTQINALQLAERGVLFETLPEINTNRNLLNLMDRDLKAVFEIQKRLDGRSPASDLVAAEGEPLEEKTETAGLNDDELAALDAAQATYEEE
ncbi:type IV secretory pathway, VirD4 protein [Weissella oryzae SG25]|uniref:Type IV secretory pathway, VirD4 protein n=1 Tax=Weissella oryzae (strain DSM 25784 / JCM 18191 / LMG 30913 / SG25) TaxID=1329250 RepID=A0A069CU70_WEIOS|nr:type IV secretory system conjugative DNA transfer family protein [Weissella oryzae]GAK31049.1 type IV secretory pathway, VirD4 protein [Weissella oryzae SG25]